MKNGKQEALKSIFDEYAQPLTFYAFRLIQIQYEAENIVQDVFIGLWKNAGNLDEDINLKAYLYVAVKNRVITAIRKARTTDFVTDDLFVIKSTDSPADIETREIELLYNKYIEQLPASCRNIFLMSREDKMTYKEIAETLGISIKTVETQMGRALKFIRKKLLHLLIFFVGVLNDFFV